MADESTQPVQEQQQLSISEFAAKIKARDPRLANVPDDVLTRKVFERRPELMKFVQTAETRKGHEKVGEKGVVGQEASSTQPGAVQRFGEAVGVPTAEQAKAAMPTSLAGKTAEVVAPGALQAGSTAINYAKLLYDKASNVMGTAKSSYEDVKSGKKTVAQGMQDTDAAATDALLRGFASMIGGDALASGLEDLKNKNYSGLAGDMAGFATLMLMMKGGKDTEAGSASPKTMVRRTERLSNTIGETTGMTDRVAIVNEAEPLVRQAMQEEGMTDQNLQRGVMGKKGKLAAREGVPEPELDAQGKPSGRYISNVRAGARRVLGTLDRAVDISNRPFERVVGEFGGEAAPETVKKPIVDTLRQLAQDNIRVNDPGLAGALNKLADTVAGTKTIGELNDIKVHANKEMQNLRAQLTPGAAIGASVQTAYAYKLAAEAIRASLYPALEEMSGVNLAKFGAREHAAIAWRDGAYSSYFRWIDRAQAQEASRGYWGGIIHGSKYTRHILERMLRIELSPAGQFVRDFREGMGPVGKGTTGESLQTIGKNQKRLSGSTAPTTFKISGNLPQEIVTGGSGADPAMSYAGQQPVSSPTHEPIAGGSRSRQHLELGSTERTIPESVFGRSKSKVRQDEIGEQQTSTPARSVAGEPTRTESRWQYLTSAKGPTQEVAISGPGALQTTSPEMAYKTLQRLQQIANSQEFMRYDFKTRGLIRDEIASLDEQLRNYAAYKGKKAPRGVTITPAKPGVVHGSPFGKAVVAAGQANKQDNQPEAQP